jgi:hypothetical protein
VAGGERGPVAQVDDPLPGLDAPAELAGVGGHHVGVVGRKRAQTVEELPNVGLLVLGQHRVGLPLLPNSGLGRIGLGRGTERPETMGGEHLRRVGQQIGQLVGRGMLVTDEDVSVLLAEQVRPAGGAVQQRTTREHPDRAVDTSAGLRVD